MVNTALIALDWGSSQLRAFRFDAAGRIVEQRASADGASQLSGGAAAFAAALHTLASDWLAPGVPVIACGMVGSAHGWREAAYVPCPVALDALHERLVDVPAGDGLVVRIVPGLSTRDADGQPDVMRGEETQLCGLLEAAPALAARACVVMPGTHSKWVRLHDGRVAGYATRMTGELYALLRGQSVLARLMPEGAGAGSDAAAFDRGVAVALRAGGADLARLLFGVRALGLFGELAPASAPDYLSGLLIGTEVASARAEAIDVPVALVGETALCERYTRAFAAGGIAAQTFDAPLAARGLWRIARAAGLT
jgi:2-dehydro-3-deoxygalactonokinase